MTKEPEPTQPTLVEELQAALAGEQQLLEELAVTLDNLRREAAKAPEELDRDAMWAEVQRRLLAGGGGDSPGTLPPGAPDAG